MFLRYLLNWRKSDKVKLIASTDVGDEFGWKCPNPTSTKYPYPHRLHVSKKGENYTINFDGSIKVHIL